MAGQPQCSSLGLIAHVAAARNADAMTLQQGARAQGHLVIAGES